MPRDTHPASLLLRNIQNEFIPVAGKSPDEPDPAAIAAIAQDFHRLAVNAARRLGSRTSAVLELPRLAIQIKQAAGGRAPAVRFDSIQGKDFASGVRLDSDRNALWPGLTGKS